MKFSLHDALDRRGSSLGLTDAATLVRALARRLAGSYIAHAQPRVFLLVGSAAIGEADEYSDLDLLVYYDHVPPQEAVAETSRELDAERYPRLRRA